MSELHQNCVRANIAGRMTHVLARAAELLDVGLRAMVNSIPRAGVAADYVEVPESLVAPPLLRREPFL